MLISTFPAGDWQTNCYVVAPSANAECIIIDPGYECVGQVADVIAKHKLKPVAALLTHGHIDHMWSVYPLSTGYDIAAYIHESDRHLLSDPYSGISPETVMMLKASLSIDLEFVEPSKVVVFDKETTVSLAGIEFELLPAPGHTQGSTIFKICDEVTTVFSGDVLFAGAIGRTDLPGGSQVAMSETLRDVVLPLPDDARVLPGHGPETTMAIERVTNPFLLRIAQGLDAV